MAAHSNGPVAYLWQAGSGRPFVVPLRALLPFDDSTPAGKAAKAEARQGFATWSERQYATGASCKNIASGFFGSARAVRQVTSEDWSINPDKVDSTSFYVSTRAHQVAQVVEGAAAILGTLSLPDSTLRPKTHVSPRTVSLHTP